MILYISIMLKDTVDIGYSDNAGGIDDILAKLSLINHFIT